LNSDKIINKMNTGFISKYLMKFKYFNMPAAGIYGYIKIFILKLEYNFRNCG